MKHSLHRFKSLESTNTKLKELALGGSPEGTVVVADSQTAGKGRGDHKWHSPVGGLYVSALLRPTAGRGVTDLSFLGGIAVAQTIKELLPKSTLVSVKWPNDCLLEKKKVAGILGEALHDADGPGILGIGINVNTPAGELAPFRNNRFPATSIALETGGSLDTERVLLILTRKLFGLHELYCAEGFATVQALWERHCAFIGHPVEMAAGSSYRLGTRVLTGEAPFTGTCLGIDETGALVLSTPEGERRYYMAGELTCFW